MKRVVLDTNVLVSAILIPESIPARLFDKMLDPRSGITLVTSPPLLGELSKVLRMDKFARYFGDHAHEVDEFVGHLKRLAVCTEGELKVRCVEADPADDFVISCALEGAASVIVSGDRHLLSMKEYEGIHIVSPREAWDNLLDGAIIHQDDDIFSTGVEWEAEK